MKRALIFLIVVASGCTSTSKTPLSGRVAIVPSSPNAGAYTVAPFVEIIRADLAARGAVVDVVDSATYSGYDKVISVTVIPPGRRPAEIPYRQREEPAESPAVDASGGLVSNRIGKLSYVILENGTRVASGAVNITPPALRADTLFEIDPQRTADIQAAHALAREIARSLARS